MTKRILLLGALRSKTLVPNSIISTCRSTAELAFLDGVLWAFANDSKIDHVFMGAGVELEKRLDIV